VIDETIAHYRIVRQLGAGGMGVVYEALDIKLERRVALKFLPETTHHNPQSLERFLREARSASALNHSGICTIHAIEEYGGRTFIAMELLEGHTLEQVLKLAPLPIPRTIDIGIQLADALDTAHKKNVVHRDIKPANVFVTDRGPVKILDFGLAKLIQGDDAHLDGQTLGGQTALLTSPGTAVGTIAYMSPEQARGQELDARSDLFSLGAVLYEMVTGKLAFPGTTSAVVFDNILHNAPVAPISLNPVTPPELERILNKALEKDCDLRYQGAAELRADLKRLQRELDPARPGSGSTRTTTATAAASSAPKSAATVVKPSSGSVLVEAAGRNKLGTGVVIGIMVVVLLAAGFGIYSLLKPAPPPPKRLPFERVEITNLTNNGHVAVARISPDGKYLLHAMEENGLQSLWLRHIPTGSNTQVVAPAATRYFGLTFSPDGNYIYFVRRDEAEHTISILYSAPVLGGIPRVVVRDVDSPVTFSPDGQRFAFLHERHDSPFWDLWTFKNDGSDKQAIFSNKPISSDSKAPIWSPDGKTILIPVTQLSLSDHGGFLAVDVATGKDQIVAATPSRVYYDAAWFPDGNALVTPAASLASGFLKIQLGYLTYPGGEFRELTVDANDYVHPSVSADGKIIAANQTQYRQQIQVAPINEAGANDWKLLPLSSQLIVWRWSWLPDGRIVLPQGGDVRIVNLAGGESVILSDRQRIPDQVTVCGKSYIAFRQVGRSGGAAANLWRMNLDGTEQKQLTSGINDTDPTCSADGKWVYYIDGNDSHYLKRVSIEGGRPETALQEPVGPYAVSPDGTKVLTLDVRDFDHKLVLRADDVETHKTEYLNVDPRASSPFGYAPGGQTIVYNVRDHGIDNLWRQALDGSARKQITRFISERIQRFAFSPDGKFLAVDRGHLESDAVLLREPANQK
jgi:eukaryotic-like serine/threonine-protein kinase